MISFDYHFLFRRAEISNLDKTNFPDFDQNN